MAAQTYRKRYFSPTTTPNGSIAGEGGGPTGDHSMPLGMPERAGTYEDHYTGQAAGGGRASAMKLADKEKRMGTAGKGPLMKQAAPYDTAGTGADDYVQTTKPLKDSETEPGGTPNKKMGKGLTFKSIQSLRDYSKSMVNSGAEAGHGGGVSSRRQYSGS